MVPRDASTSIDSRLGRIEEAISSLKEDRREDRQDQRADSDKIAGRLDGLTQVVGATANAVSALGLERCGERLDKIEARNIKADMRFEALEKATAPVPWIESELLFWQRLLGGGWRAAWKIVAVMAGSGGIGAIIVKAADAWLK